MGHCCRSACTSSSRGAARPELGQPRSELELDAEDPCKKEHTKGDCWRNRRSTPPAVHAPRGRRARRDCAAAGASRRACRGPGGPGAGWAARGYSPSSVTLSARAVTPFTWGGNRAFRDSCALGAGAPSGPRAAWGCVRVPSAALTASAPTSPTSRARKSVTISNWSLVVRSRPWTGERPVVKPTDQDGVRGSCWLVQDNLLNTTNQWDGT